MQRRIDLEGCFNFRDLGGYPTQDGRRVRWRQLFRSDALHHLTSGDVERVTAQLGVRHVVDLRSSGELEAEGRGLLAEAPGRFHHLPLFDGQIPSDPSLSFDEITLADRYFMLLEFAQEPIARVLATLAESEAPAVYHCAAGKDRTGVISALLLALLGVSDAAIVADYAATQETLDAVVDRLLTAQSYQETLSTLPADTLHAEPETMLRLLDQLRERFGSVEGYAAKIGISRSLVDGLRERVLEDA